MLNPPNAREIKIALFSPHDSASTSTTLTTSNTHRLAQRIFFSSTFIFFLNIFRLLNSFTFNILFFEDIFHSLSFFGYTFYFYLLHTQHPMVDYSIWKFDKCSTSHNTTHTHGSVWLDLITTRFCMYKKFLKFLLHCLFFSKIKPGKLRKTFFRRELTWQTESRARILVCDSRVAFSVSFPPHAALLCNSFTLSKHFHALRASSADLTQLSFSSLSLSSFDWNVVGWRSGWDKKISQNFIRLHVPHRNQRQLPYPFFFVFHYIEFTFH